MKILIAGGSGLIGSFLYQKLKKQVFVTSINDSNYFGGKNFVNLDLTNKIETMNFSKVTDRFDILIFLVGLAHSKGKGKDLSKFKKINYQTLVNLLSALDSSSKIPKK